MTTVSHPITTATDLPSGPAGRRRALLLTSGVLVAALGAFLLGTGWYVVFGPARNAMLAGNAAAATTVTPSIAVVVPELIREAVVAAGVSFAVGRARIRSFAGGVSAALIAWVTFPGVLLTGSVLWDGTPPSLAAIHGGDWLIKLILAGTSAVAVHRRIDADRT